MKYCEICDEWYSDNSWKCSKCGRILSESAYSKSDKQAIEAKSVGIFFMSASIVLTIISMFLIGSNAFIPLTIIDSIAFTIGFFICLFTRSPKQTTYEIRETECPARQFKITTTSQSETDRLDKRMLRNGGWECVCGRMNPSYTGTCACGKTKQESMKKDPESSGYNMSHADEIKKYKDLLDSGAITQEEFDAKKKQLLGL